MGEAYRRRLSECYSWRQRVEAENESTELKPPQFDGTGNIIEFFEELEEFFETKPIPEVVRHIYLRRALKGQAKDWFKAIGKHTNPEEGESKYKAVKKAIKVAYPPKRDTVKLEAEFFATSQNQKEAPDTFVLKMCNLHDDLELAYTEGKLVEHILKRLQPVVRDYLEVRDVSTRTKLFNLTQIYAERHRQERYDRAPPQDFYSHSAQEHYRGNGNPRYFREHRSSGDIRGYNQNRNNRGHQGTPQRSRREEEYFPRRRNGHTDVKRIQALNY